MDLSHHCWAKLIRNSEKTYKNDKMSILNLDNYYSILHLNCISHKTLFCTKIKIVRPSKDTIHSLTHKQTANSFK